MTASYKQINFGPWALAVVLVSLPVLVIPGRWAWAYVALILAYYIIYNLDELGSLIEFVQTYIPNKE